MFIQNNVVIVILYGCALYHN